MAGPPPRLRLAAVRRRRSSPSSGTRASARCGSATDPAQRPQRVDWGLLLRSGRDTRRCCRALAPASSIQIPRARSAVELQPAAVQCARRAHSKRGSAISRRPLVDSRSDARCVLACLPREGHGHFQRDLWNHPHHPLSSRHPTRPAAAILGRECNICAALAIRRVCSAPRRRGSPSRTNTLRSGGARRDPRCEIVGGARVLALSGTAAGAQRAQIRPTRVQEGGSDTAKRCFRVDPASSRSSLQKYLFARSLPPVPLCAAEARGRTFLNRTLKHPRRTSRSIWSRTARSGVSLARPVAPPCGRDRGEATEERRERRLQRGTRGTVTGVVRACP